MGAETIIENVEMTKINFEPRPPTKNQRLDREEYRVIGQPVFFTVRAYKRARPFENADLARAVVDCLMQDREKWGCSVYAYSLLPDHIHIIPCPREAGSDALTFIDRFKGETTRISWDHGCQGKLWQPRSHDHIIRKSEDLAEICQYVIHNPVRLGLVEAWQDYPFGGLVDPVPE